MKNHLFNFFFLFVHSILSDFISFIFLSFYLPRFFLASQFFISNLIFSILFTPWEFFTSVMLFYWSLSDSKAPQVSRTLLNILADLNNAAVWMVSPSLLVSKSSSPFNNPLVTVQKPPSTIDIMVKYKFLTHLPVDPLADQVASSLILLLWWFAPFAYYVIYGFISVTAYPIFAIFLRLI